MQRDKINHFDNLIFMSILKLPKSGKETIMRKTLAALCVCIPTLFLSSCYVTSVPADNYYYAGYSPGYVNYGWGGGYYNRAWGGYRGAWYGNGGAWGHHGGWGYAGRHGGWHGGGHRR